MVAKLIGRKCIHFCALNIPLPALLCAKDHPMTMLSQMFELENILFMGIFHTSEPSCTFIRGLSVRVNLQLPQPLDNNTPHGYLCT